MKIFNIIQEYYSLVRIQKFDMVLKLKGEEYEIFRNKKELCQFKMLYNLPDFFPEGDIAKCFRNILSENSTYMDMFNYIVCAYPEIRKVVEEVFPEFTYV